jgi:hypothetical protein
MGAVASMGVGYTWVRVGERKAFFFEKKKQKTFGRAVADFSGERATARKKVFWFFFSKKNILPFATSAAAIS